MELYSSAFKDGGRIPEPYAMPEAGGNSISIPLNWINPPEETRSFALSMVDLHPDANNGVHWLVINIPPVISSLEEVASTVRMPSKAVELRNSFGEIGYGGPHPPPGTGDHPYVITLYALNVEKLDLDVEADSDQFRKALEGKVIAEARLTGLYGVGRR